MDADPCKGLPLDLYHRMRRKESDRRAAQRTLSDDYYAFQSESFLSTSSTIETQKN